MKRAAIYARISKDTEGEGLGVARQETECRQLAERLDLEVVAGPFVDNDTSAYSGKRRPGYEALLDAIAGGQVDVVLAWHPDRLHRSPKELEGFIDVLDATGVTVETVTSGRYDLSTASGRQNARIVGAVARGESEHKSERLRSKMDQLAATGGPPGGRPPYGYRRVGKSYEPDLDEALVVRRIAQEILAGRSLLSIAGTLNNEGVPTREGRPWHHSTVRAVVTNPAIAARRVHRRQVVGRGTWAPILDPDLFDELGVRLSDPARKRRQKSDPYLLTGLLFTPAGDHLVGRLDRERRTYATPRAPHPRKGPGVAIDADRLDELVIEAALERYDDVALPAPEYSDQGDVAAIEAELAEWSALRGAGEITLEEWRAGREPMLARLADAKAAAGAAHSQPITAEPGELRVRWKALTFTEKRAVLAAAIERIEVRPAGGRGRWANIIDRVSVDWT